MPEIERLMFKDDDDEYEIYVESSRTFNIPEEEPQYRDINLPTVDLQKVHKTLRGYAIYAIGAFKDLGEAKVEKVVLKFNIKIAGKSGIPMLVEGSAEGSFEIQVECKFPEKISITPVAKETIK